MPASKKPHILLLTGRPGVGKTTLIRKVAATLADKKIAGFFTQEMRARGVRQGFKFISFGGEEYVLAHVEYAKQFRVGKYGVNVSLLEELAHTVLAPGQPVDLFLVDEIGKMECLSHQFVNAMRQLLNSDLIVVASIALRGEAFIEEVKKRDDVALWEINPGNRDAMPQQVVNWVKQAL